MANACCFAGFAATLRATSSGLFTAAAPAPPAGANTSVASPFANFRHLNVELDPGRHPRTKAYIDRILARPSFAPLVAKEAAFLERTAA
jgi:glutathione S-transferase